MLTKRECLNGNVIWLNAEGYVVALKYGCYDKICLPVKYNNGEIKPVKMPISTYYRWVKKGSVVWDFQSVYENEEEFNKFFDEDYQANYM